MLMLSEPDASRSGNSGLVSTSTRRYLNLVIASVDLWNERRNGSERGLAQCTATWAAGALRQPQGALTSARADADDRKEPFRRSFHSPRASPSRAPPGIAVGDERNREAQSRQTPDGRARELGARDEAHGRDAAVGGRVVVVVVVDVRWTKAAEQLVRVDECAAAHGHDRAAARHAPRRSVARAPRAPARRGSGTSRRRRRRRPSCRCR